MTWLFLPGCICLEASIMTEMHSRQDPVTFTILQICQEKNDLKLCTFAFNFKKVHAARCTFFLSIFWLTWKIVFYYKINKWRNLMKILKCLKKLKNVKYNNDRNNTWHVVCQYPSKWRSWCSYRPAHDRTLKINSW